MDRGPNAKFVTRRSAVEARPIPRAKDAVTTLARRHWPLIAALILYWIAVAALVWHAMRLNQGQWVYPLDDAYIHMAIAKNAAVHHVWGVTRYEFTSSTSSPFWTALLAAVYWIGGVNDVAPLVLNVLFGSSIVLAAYGLMRKDANRLRTCIVLLSVVFVSPLPTLTVSGMEHTLHALVMLLFASWSATAMASSEPVPFKRGLGLVALAPILTTVRYEGFFALVVVVALLAATKHRWAAATIGATGLLAPALYGLWATLHGWYFVPNSVLLNGYLPAPTAMGLGRLLLWWHGLNVLVESPGLLVLLVASLIVVMFLLASATWDDRVFMNMIFIAVTLLHAEFSATGALYRYEAYLFVAGLVVLGAMASHLTAGKSLWDRGRWPLPVYPVAALLMVVVSAPFAIRGASALRDTAQASHNIFEQQYQMASFVNRYYAGRTVAANDIGAITYFADIRLVDLYGLGSIEPARWMRAGTYTQARIQSLTTKRGVDIAIAYDDWFAFYGGLPVTWHKAGEWAVHDNVILGGPTVSFYAVRSAETATLVRHLKAFGPKVPGDVEQRGEFTE
jgi:hypothetical protein